MLINNKFASPNFSKRSKLIEYAILHFTEMPFEGSLARLCDKAYEVSAHYLIKEDGEMFQLVDDKNVAWHAGVSSWCGQDKLNQNSIGIELDNLGDREFSKVQMNSCIELCKILAKKYDILAENFIGHSDVAPARKIDPGIFFDWKSLSKQGFGIWHELTAPTHYEDVYKFGATGDGVIEIQSKLKKLGYSIEVNGSYDNQTSFVVRSFLAKFNPELIKDLGLKHYNNPESKYNWTSYADNILNKLTHT